MFAAVLSLLPWSGARYVFLRCFFERVVNRGFADVQQASNCVYREPLSQCVPDALLLFGRDGAGVGLGREGLAALVTAAACRAAPVVAVAHHRFSLAAMGATGRLDHHDRQHTSTRPIRQPLCWRIQPGHFLPESISASGFPTCFDLITALG